MSYDYQRFCGCCLSLDYLAALKQHPQNRFELLSTMEKAHCIKLYQLSLLLTTESTDILIYLVLLQSSNKCSLIQFLPLTRSDHFEALFLTASHFHCKLLRGSEAFRTCCC